MYRSLGALPTARRTTGPANDDNANSIDATLTSTTRPTHLHHHLLELRLRDNLCTPLVDNTLHPVQHPAH